MGEIDAKGVDIFTVVVPDELGQATGIVNVRVALL
jgi:hypothetical protein